MTFSVFGLPSQTFPKENRVSFRRSQILFAGSNSADSVIPQPHLLVLLHRLLRPMPTAVAASRISTWVFSTKNYTEKLIFVTKLGLWLVRVLLKEVSLPYHSTSTTAWIEHLILDLIIMFVYFVFMSLECPELPCQSQNRSHWQGCYLQVWIIKPLLDPLSPPISSVSMLSFCFC